VCPRLIACVVRAADRDDIGAIASLRSLWSGDHRFEAAFDQRMQAWLTAEGERRTTCLATVNDRPVGMASMFEYRRMPWPDRPDSRWGYVSNMFVREDHRRKRIGSALLSALIRTAEERSYVRVVVSPSTDSVSFYRSAGFIAADGAEGDLLLVRPNRAGRPAGNPFDGDT
jgi:GNAT superfamily N-acetyltransferase